MYLLNHFAFCTRTFVATLLFLLMTNANSQSTTNCQYDSVYSYYYTDSVNKIADGKEYTTFNNIQQPITKITIYKNSFSGKWVPSYKELYLYNADLKNIETRTYQWDTLAQNWVNNYRDIYTYNSFLQITKQETQRWSNGQWEPNTKNEIEYDNAQRESLYSSFRWDDNSWSWLEESHYTTTHFPNGLVDEINSSVWVPSAGFWEPLFRYNYQYNTKNLEVLVISQKYNSGRWDKYQRITSLYNDKDQKIESIYEAALGLSWEKQNKETYEYNAKGCLSKYHYYFDWTDYHWVQHSEDQYDFSIEKPNTNFMSVFPNPTNTFVNIPSLNVGTFRIISATGESVLQGKVIEGINTIDIAVLRSGIYFILTGDKKYKLMVP